MRDQPHHVAGLLQTLAQSDIWLNVSTTTGCNDSNTHDLPLETEVLRA
jgi:hypothetical protein